RRRNRIIVRCNQPSRCRPNPERGEKCPGDALRRKHARRAISAEVKLAPICKRRDAREGLRLRGDVVKKRLRKRATGLRSGASALLVAIAVTAAAVNVRPPARRP